VTTTTTLASNMRVVGDVTGDGLPDFLTFTAVSQVSGVGFGFVYTGSFTVRSGATGQQIFTSPTPIADAAGISDVDGDGLADLAIEILPTFPASAATLRHVSGVSGTVVTNFLFTNRSMASIPDADGDGVRELVVGQNGGSNAAQLVIYDGPGYVQVTVVTLPLPSGYGATSITDIGDVDGDGIRDIAVIREFLNAGADPVRTIVVRGGTWTVLYDFIGGNHVSPLGDLNGDGRDDFAIHTFGQAATLSTPAVNATMRWVNGATGSVERLDTFASNGYLRSAAVSGSPAVNGRVLLTNPTIFAPAGRIERLSFNPILNASVSTAAPTLGIAARGNLGSEALGPFNTLSVQGTFGGAARRAFVARNQPLTIQLAASPTLGAAPSQFAIFGTLFDPGQTGATVVPQIGTMVFPPSVLFPQFPWLFLLAESITGQSIGIFPALPGPYSLTLPVGLPFPITFTLQAVATEGPSDFAVTNAMIVDVL
jgi:hypothetical protein